MQYTIRRMIERGIIEHRNDAAFVREAMRQGHRYDQVGTITRVFGDAIYDKAQHWITDPHGKATIDGKAVPGDTLFMVDGDAAGQSWEIEHTHLDALQVVGGVDLDAEGVKAGDEYEIRRGVDERAAAWLASKDIRCILQFPGDHKLLPYYAVLEEADVEQSNPALGRHFDETCDADGVSRTLISEWQESYVVLCCGRNADEAVWLGRMWSHLYRMTVRYFDRIFTNPVQLRGGGLRRIEIGGEKGSATVFATEWRLTGTRHKFAQEVPPWLNPSTQAKALTMTPRYVELKTS